MTAPAGAGRGTGPEAGQETGSGKARENGAESGNGTGPETGAVSGADRGDGTGEGNGREAAGRTAGPGGEHENGHRAIPGGAAAETTPADARAIEPARSRLHPLTMVSGTARDVAGILLAGATGLAAAGPVTGAWFALGCWLLGSLNQFVRWWTFTYTIHQDRLELRRSFIGRSVTSVPLDRIRGVDISAAPQHRLLRLAVVHIDAAAGAGIDEGRLDAVSRAEAERLRGFLLGDAGAGAHGARSERGRAGAVLARARPRWYLFAPLSGAYLLTPFAILGVLYNVGGDLGLLGERRMARFAGDAADVGPLGAVAVVLVFALLMPLLSVIVFAIFNWDFTLRSAGGTGQAGTRQAGTGQAGSGEAGSGEAGTGKAQTGRIEEGRDGARVAVAAAPAPHSGELVAERGIGTRRSVSLERRRIRGVELRDNPLERLAGVVRLGAVVTGLGDSEHRGRLLPTAPRRVAFDVVTKVVGGMPAPLRAHPPAARRRRVIRAVLPPIMVGGIALSAGRPWVLTICAIAAVLAVPLGWDRYRQLGHASDGTLLAIRSGSLRRRQAVVEHRAVVGWQLRQTFFQRRLGLATLVAAVGAGDGAYPITDMAESDAIAFAGRVTPDWVLPFTEEAAADAPRGGDPAATT